MSESGIALAVLIVIFVLHHLAEVASRITDTDPCFLKCWLLAVSAGARPTTGHSIEITEIDVASLSAVASSSSSEDRERSLRSPTR